MSAPQHPPWCATSRCEATLGRFHTSVPAVIRARSGARLAVRLYAADHHQPILELIVGHHEDGQRWRIDLTPTEAAQLHHQLGAALNHTTGADQPGHDGYRIGARYPLNPARRTDTP